MKLGSKLGSINNYDNRRVSKTVNGTTTYYIYEAHKLIGEYKEDGTVIKEYLYYNSTPIAIITSTDTYKIYADHLDTPRRVADQDNKIVWSWESKPFGEDKPTGTLALNLRFPGQYYDSETGKHYNINRDYDPVTGRYIQSDPIGFEGGVNTYVYVNGNPIVRVDALGLVDENFVDMFSGNIPANIIINMQATFYNNDEGYTILAHGYHGFSYQPNLHKTEISNRARQSGKSYIELLICEAGQHDEEFMIDGKNIAEILHTASGMMVKYTEDYVHVSPLAGPYLENSPSAKSHGWKWLW